jgi:branched-chain amino acid transport system substrate-binding protein
MSRPNKPTIVAAAVLGAALLAAPLPALAQATSSAPAGGSIRLGAAGPISGGSAAFGLQFKEGVEQAVADINRAGGILGQKVTLVIGDDRADPKDGVAVANRFVGDGVKIVIGHFNSGVTIPASEVYQEHGILQITPASTNPQVTERGMWNIFRTCGRDDQQGLVAGDYILKNFRGTKIAIVHDKTTYGQGLAELTRAMIRQGGIAEVLYEGVNRGDKDFSALVSKIKASGAGLVYWGGLHDTGGMILRQMRDQGVRVQVMAGDGITDDEFAAVAGPGAEGTLMTYSADPRGRPEAQAALDRFRARNVYPQVYTLYSYAAVEIIKQAAEAAKLLDPKRMAELMKSGMKFRTVIGEISYDSKGDITQLDYVVYVWKKDASGKLTYTEMQ